MATISITTFEFSIPVSYFLISLTRKTSGNLFEVCLNSFGDDHMLRRNSTDSKLFTQNFFNLEENSTYVATVRAVFRAPAEGLNKSSTLEIVTPPARKIIL